MAASVSIIVGTRSPQKASVTICASTLSDFIREAVSSFIKEIELAKTKKELEEGYKANYSYYANLNKEWVIADSE